MYSCMREAKGGACKGDRRARSRSDERERGSRCQLHVCFVGTDPHYFIPPVQYEHRCYNSTTYELNVGYITVLYSCMYSIIRPSPPPS